MDKRTENILTALNDIARTPARFSPREYGVDEGPRRDRIWYRGTSGGRSVLCFVDKVDGLILYSNGWKSPAKWKSGPASEFDASEALTYAEFIRDGRWGYKGERAAWERGV